MSELIKLCGVTKSFGKVQSLAGVDFSLNGNEIVALLGDNGAGKSTLVKIISGLLPPDAGTIHIKGTPLRTSGYSVARARKMGIETVYQQSSFGESQPLWRNIFTGRHLTNRLGFIRVKEEKRETLKIMKEMVGLSGAGITPDSAVGRLSGGERQGLAMGRAMYFNASIILLDEPATALSVKEVDRVLGFIKKIKREGKSAIMVTHNLAHACDVADRFVIMDKGKVAMDFINQGVTPARLAEKLLHFSMN